MAKGKFLRVKCTNCKEEAIIFEKATTEIKCKSCDNMLAKPAGGKAKLNSKILEVLH